MLNNTQEDKLFVSVLADGRLHMTVPEGTEKAIKRTYETSDGKTGEKWELVYTELSGKITDVRFYDGDYGTQLQVTVTDREEKPVVLSLSTGSNYGEDMMKKLLSVDMDKPVRIVPYSFTDDNGKTKKGITIYQDEKKVQNYFYDAEKKKNIHDYPDPVFPAGKKKLSTEEWKIYFAQCRVFLINSITKFFKLDEEKEIKF